MFIGAGPRSVARVTTSFGLARSIGGLRWVRLIEFSRSLRLPTRRRVSPLIGGQGIERSHIRHRQRKLSDIGDACLGDLGLPAAIGPISAPDVR
jgi:hypothetical protein